MMHQIARELQARLTAKGCTTYGVTLLEDTNEFTSYAPLIVIEHVSDTFDAPRGLSTNPKKHYSRTSTVTITVYGRSLKPGAKSFEHRYVVEQVMHLVVVGMRYVAADRLNRYLPKGGRFIVPEDLKKGEAQNGAAYEFTFTFERAISELGWDGESFPEGNIAGGVLSTTRVSPTFGPDDDDDPTTPPATAETACGS